jgi:uncharacterized protein YqfA (UPF0365 family)
VTATANINLLIGTPAYAGQVHVDYVSALLVFQRERVPFTLMTIGNESLITRARNTIVSAFHERREFTHLLFLDGDVHLPHEGLARLLAHGRDVVAAPVALKGVAPDGGRLFNVGKTVGEDGPLLVVDRVGTAALLLSRAAADALVADARAEQRVYEASALAQPEGSIQYDVFRVGVVDGEYLSEDFWVCHVLRRLGFRIHVDPAIVTRHNGMVAL